MLSSLLIKPVTQHIYEFWMKIRQTFSHMAYCSSVSICNLRSFETKEQRRKCKEALPRLRRFHAQRVMEITITIIKIKNVKEEDLKKVHGVGELTC